MKIGIICPSEIALRRFMPAAKTIKELEFIGLGICTPYERFGSNLPDVGTVNAIISSQKEKAMQFIEKYGGKLFDSYEAVVTSDDIDMVYIPLPPTLHCKWAKLALENGKHVLIEKPATTSLKDTEKLVELAERKGLALHENYMFEFHDQLQALQDIITSGEIGCTRLYRITFGFPRRRENDFRYSSKLGGGALIDAGGYTIKYASMLLGNSAKVLYARMNFINDFDVDLYGSGALADSDGATVQIAFGMDNNYKCELEVWGSKGCLTTDRVLTAPAGFTPEVVIRKGNVDEKRKLPADDAFAKSINRFLDCVMDENSRKLNYAMIIKQAELVDEFIKMAQK